MSEWNSLTISNVIPRQDVNGNILDAHGGPHFNIFENRYYNYGVHYMDTDGFSFDQHYVSYSSTDFENWEFHGRLLEKSAPEGLYFRPHVLFSEKLGCYVLWYLWYEKYIHAGNNICHKGVALSDSPSGPFEIQDTEIKLSGGLSGDHDLFQDDDGTAYLVYSAHDFSRKNGKNKEAVITVERLSDDLLTSTRESVRIDAEGIPCEAPAMFKRNGTYYLMFDRWTDRGPRGSGARVYTSDKPLGPYEYRGNVNRHPGGTPIIKAQQNTVAPVETPQGTEYIWVGDRWKSADKMGESFQFWCPLRFRDDGSIETFSFINEWELTVRKF
ncbi:MAG: family 43 glycosylhydrolase [Spirochaetales bacterium]|nr:family 43 glycosylhydrolase [Spirochaetales bacterium]